MQTNDRCETARIDRDADETERCGRCEALPDLGPMRRAPLGEVRLDPATGLVAVAVDDTDGMSRAAGHGWRVVGLDPLLSVCFGWRGDWDVAGWDTVGNVLEMAGVAQ